MLEQFLEWYKSIKKNKVKDTYSPHKPLTILYALASVRKNKRWIEYNQDRQELEDLIAEFTNYKTRPNCLQPLWRLQNDSKEYGIWKVAPNDLIVNRSGDITNRQAIKSNFKAGFEDKTYEWLRKNQAITQFLIGEIIEDNFPDTLAETLILKLGLDDIVPEVVSPELITSTIQRPKRDPNFPKRILALYDYHCCFCGLKIYLNTSPIPMEAAHIKWKAQGGECSESNGMALCPTHHFTFDRGLWSLDENYRVTISANAMIDGRSDPFFRPFEGKSIEAWIMDKSLLPTEDNLRWHRKNIFK